MSQKACLSPHTRAWEPMHGRRVGCRGRVRPHRRASIIAHALKGVLCDLDGVIYASGSSTVIPGATETLEYLREHQIPWLFVTNTNSQNREGLAARLRAMGIACTAGDIVSPAKLAADWLRTHNNGPAALFVAPELVTEFDGIPLLPPTAESGAAAVVIGDMGLDWNYGTINRAFRLVMEGELRMEAAGLSTPLPQCGSSNGSQQPALPPQQPPPQQPRSLSASQAVSPADECVVPDVGNGAARPLTLISLGKGRYYKDADGYSIDVGPFTAALEFATETKAAVFGKPDPLIFCLAAESLGLQPEEVVMIGDDVRGDVGGAQAAGLRGVLVKTGKFREHDLAVGVTPDAVLPSIADFPAWWEGQQQQERERQQQHQQQQHGTQQPGFDSPGFSKEVLQQQQQQQQEASLGRSKPPTRFKVVPT